jgi:hypothetical protein
LHSKLVLNAINSSIKFREKIIRQEDYFLSSSSAQISKSSTCAKVTASRNSLYYRPKLLAKDLLLKGQIEAVLFEHKSYNIAELHNSLNQ